MVVRPLDLRAAAVSLERPGRAVQAVVERHTKFVASRTLDEPLAWPHSTLLRGNLVDAVRALKSNTDGVLAIMGSGELIRSLISTDLVDEYLLMIHPLVLGTGRRMFPDGNRMPLRLISSTTSAAGVVIAVYEPATD